MSINRNKEPVIDELYNNNIYTRLTVLYFLAIILFFLVLVTTFIGIIINNSWQIVILVTSLVSWVMLFALIIVYRREFTNFRFKLLGARSAAQQRQWEKFEKYISEARKISGRTDDEILFGNLLHTSAVLLFQETKYAKADLLFREAIEIYECQEVINDNVLATCYANHGTNLSQWDRLEEADIVLKMGFQIATNAGPEVRWLRSICRLNRGLNALKTGKWQAARLLLVQAQEGLLQKENVEVVWCTLKCALAMWELRNGDPNLAEKLTHEALELAEVLNGDSELYRINPLSMMGLICFHKGKIREAQDYYAEIMDMITKGVVPLAPYTSEFYFWLGRIELLSGNNFTAERHFRKGLRIRDDFGTPDCYEMAEHLQAFAELLRSTGRPVEAQVMEERARKAFIVPNFSDTTSTTDSSEEQHHIKRSRDQEFFKL